MAIEILSGPEDRKFKIVCPTCKGLIICDAKSYETDARKPILSNCPYCGVGIFSCMLLLASTDLRNLQKMLTIAVNSLYGSVGKGNVIVDGTVLKSLQ
jgi:hypothetical protein